MDYRPQKITMALLRKVANARPPDAPREIRDRARGIVLRHQPSGYMALYAQLGRGRRERICNARDVLDDYHPLTLSSVFERAKALHGEAAIGRDFAGERRAHRVVPTLSEYLDSTYEAWVRKNRRSGAATVQRIRACFEERFGRRKLTEITPALLEGWRAARKVKPETINRDIGALRSALARAVKLEVIAANPLEAVEPAETDPNKRVVRALTAVEKVKVLEALEARDNTKRAGRARANEWRLARGYAPLPPIGRFSDALTPAVIVSLETGVRRGELFGMEWGRSVDFEGKTIRVRGKTYETRDIPLNRVALETLRAWWMQQGQPKDGYVFTIEGERLKNLRKSYHGVLADAGIQRINSRGERVNWHSLRHTFGSLLGAAGIDPTTLMRLMGHANLKTTQRYLHTDERRMREAVDRLA